ncbi:hypothetical protein HDV00_007013 [Rhizophlyctis rosea]|nr:hypothetical protein HDV00_007013 [Rhizophlyctis rosea]
MPSQDSYLIIGGTGFVGGYIVSQLLNRKETVSILDLNIPKTTDPRLKAALKGDITDLDALRSAFKGYTVVIHTASPVHEGVPESIFWKVNVDGTKNVIQACVDAGVKKLVYTSSASVTFYGQPVVNEDETVPYCAKHMNVYNETKAIGEQAVLEANGKGGLLTCALRPAGIFGPNDRQGCYGFLNAAKQGNYKFVLGNNETLFDYTYVENVAYAHLLAADKLSSQNGSAGQAFNITNTEPIFFWDFCRYFFAALGIPGNKICRFNIPTPVAYVLGHITDTLKLIVSPFKKIDPTFTAFRVQIITSNRYLDCSKAQRILGYEPPYKMEEALERTMVFWKKVWEEEKKAGRA